MTARKDLDGLSEQGRLRRVHKGATFIPHELPVLQLVHEQLSEKQQIGRVDANLVENGETIFLGSGTTALEIARNLLN